MLQANAAHEAYGSADQSGDVGILHEGFLAVAIFVVEAIYQYVMHQMTPFSVLHMRDICSS